MSTAKRAIEASIEADNSEYPEHDWPIRIGAVIQQGLFDPTGIKTQKMATEVVIYVPDDVLIAEVQRRGLVIPETNARGGA